MIIKYLKCYKNVKFPATGKTHCPFLCLRPGCYTPLCFDLDDTSLVVFVEFVICAWAIDFFTVLMVFNSHI